MRGRKVKSRDCALASDLVRAYTMPYLDGDIPETRSYGIFISQLVRFCSVNSTFIGFHDDVSNQVKKFCKQGFLILIAALRKKFIKKVV